MSVVSDVILSMSEACIVSGTISGTCRQDVARGRRWLGGKISPWRACEICVMFWMQARRFLSMIVSLGGGLCLGIIFGEGNNRCLGLGEGLNVEWASRVGVQREGRRGCEYKGDVEWRCWE